MGMLPLGMEPRSDKAPPLPGWALARPNSLHQACRPDVWGVSRAYRCAARGHGRTRQGDPASEQRRLREETAARARSQLSGQVLEKFNTLLERALRAYPLREHNVFYTMDSPLALVRYAVLEAGRRMQRARAITAVDDVFYGTADEVQEWLRGTSGDLRPVVRRRRAERAWILAHPGPASYGTPPPPPPTTKWLPAPTCAK